MTNNKCFWLKRLFNFGRTGKGTNFKPNLIKSEKQKFANEYENKESLNWHFCYDDTDNYEFPLIRKSNGERIGYSPLNLPRFWIYLDLTLKNLSLDYQRVIKIP